MFSNVKPSALNFYHIDWIASSHIHVQTALLGWYNCRLCKLEDDSEKSGKKIKSPATLSPSVSTIFVEADEVQGSFFILHSLQLTVQKPVDVICKPTSQMSSGHLSTAITLTELPVITTSTCRLHSLGDMTVDCKCIFVREWQWKVKKKAPQPPPHCP